MDGAGRAPLMGWVMMMDLPTYGRSSGRVAALGDDLAGPLRPLLAGERSTVAVRRVAFEAEQYERPAAMRLGAMLRIRRSIRATQEPSGRAT